LFERLPFAVRKTLAWSVHLFTATGAVWGLLAILAIFEQNWKMVFVWQLIAMFVDGFDGMLARWFHVKEYAKGVDGGLMDNIIDYINYVLVAALLLVKWPDLMPAGFEVAAACSILLTSAYQFSQLDAKTSDDKSYFFKGFPSVWNILVFYLIMVGLSPWANFLIVIICDILVFVPIKYVYPTRNTRLRKTTLSLSILYLVLCTWGLLQYPDVPKWVVWISLLYIVYYTVLSVFPKIGERKIA
jgi:phosphatidylcholine synthase